MDADRDWEEAALNTRHIHNRNDRGGRGNTRESFQIRSTFGTHLVKCPALARLQQKTTPPGPSSNAKVGTRSKQAGKNKGDRSNSASSDLVLEIYRLADDENGILGSLKFPGVFEASVVFAGSRKTLGNVTRGLGQDDTASESPYGKRRGSLASASSLARKVSKQPNGVALAGESKATYEEGEDEEDEENEEDDDDDDDENYSDGEKEGLESREHRQRRRVATFEKNSFRQPKFWFRWQGVVSDDVLADQDDLELQESNVHGSGYVVFSGNDCRRFQGTMTSEKMKWNNIKMTGWKAKPQPERDFEIQWSREA
ncbi:unnamed protein product [Discula destructiva]